MSRAGCAAPRRAGSTCAASTPTRVGIALDETTTARDLERSGGSTRSRGRAANPTADASTATVARGRRRRTPWPAGARPHERVPHAPGLQRAPLRDARCCATCKRLEARDLSLDALDDPARLVHDEAQRDGRDDADHLARVEPHPPVRAARAGRGLPRRSSAELEAMLARDHRLPGGLAAAQRRLAGRVRRACSSSASSTRARGQGHRNVCLIPASAHGTNPASARDGGHAGRRRRRATTSGNVDVARSRGEGRRSTPTTSPR